MRSVILAATAGAIFELWCLEAGWASEPVNPNLSPEARQVFSYLESTYQKQVLAGYNVYVHTPDDYEQTGKQAAARRCDPHAACESGRSYMDCLGEERTQDILEGCLGCRRPHRGDPCRPGGRTLHGLLRKA